MGELPVQGIKAEYALAVCYDESGVDRTVSELSDDGVDGHVDVEGERLVIDVKSSSYAPPWIMVKRGYSHEEAGAFVASHVEDDTVTFWGFEYAEDMLRKENLEKSSASGARHRNYTITNRYFLMPIRDATDQPVIW